MSAARTCPGRHENAPHRGRCGAFAVGGAAERGQEGPAAPDRSHWQAGGTHNGDLLFQVNGVNRTRSPNHVEPVRAGASGDHCSRAENCSGNRERDETCHRPVLLTVRTPAIFQGGPVCPGPGIWVMGRGWSSHAPSHRREKSCSALAPSGQGAKAGDAMTISPSSSSSPRMNRAIVSPTSGEVINRL